MEDKTNNLSAFSEMKFGQTGQNWKLISQEQAKKNYCLVTKFRKRAQQIRKLNILLVILSCNIE